MPVKFRRDIEGLRGIAVGSVILFHLGLGFAQGGFVGVDIFFVISGYLISSIIFEETTAKKFSFTHFYVRRARRILPAFYFVSFITLLCAFVLFSPDELIELSKNFLAAALFVANIYDFKTSNYFTPIAEGLPFLHYWTLSVEEQFYLFFPLLIIAVQRFLPDRLTFILLTLLILSYLASVFLTPSYPTMAFYLLPFRSFELLLGCVAAMPSVSAPRSNAGAAISAGTGLVFIFIAVFALSPSVYFPGAAAALPCIGAFLLIWGGKTRETAAGNILGLLPLRLLGRISYSLYLVHWPVIVFGILLLPEMNPHIRAALLVFIAICFAVFSYRFIETPFRQNHFWTARKIKAFSFACTLAALLAVSVTNVASGFPGRFSGRIAYLESFPPDDSAAPWRNHSCFLDIDEPVSNFSPALCIPQSSGHTALIWGDSTGAALYSGLVIPLSKAGYKLGYATSSNCAPIVGLDVPGRPNCQPFNNKILSLVLAQRPALIILESSWLINPADFDLFKSMLIRLQTEKLHVVILGPSPAYPIQVPRLLADREIFCNQNTEANKSLMPNTIQMDASLQHFAAQSSTNYVSILAVLCKDNTCRLVDPHGVPIEFDYDHFTGEGANYIGALIAPSIVAHQ